MEKIGAVQGASEVRSQLYKARRALIAREPDQNQALKELDATLQLYGKELAWRQKAAQRCAGRAARL